MEFGYTGGWFSYFPPNLLIFFAKRGIFLNAGNIRYQIDAKNIETFARINTLTEIILTVNKQTLCVLDPTPLLGVLNENFRVTTRMEFQLNADREWTKIEMKISRMTV